MLEPLIQFILTPVTVLSLKTKKQVVPAHPSLIQRYAWWGMAQEHGWMLQTQPDAMNHRCQLANPTCSDIRLTKQLPGSDMALCSKGLHGEKGCDLPQRTFWSIDDEHHCFHDVLSWYPLGSLCTCCFLWNSTRTSHDSYFHVGSSYPCLPFFLSSSIFLYCL